MNADPQPWFDSCNEKLYVENIASLQLVWGYPGKLKLKFKILYSYSSGRSPGPPKLPFYATYILMIQQKNGSSLDPTIYFCKLKALKNLNIFTI